jgi:hypothetical protein
VIYCLRRESLPPAGQCWELQGIYKSESQTYDLRGCCCGQSSSFGPKRLFNKNMFCIFSSQTVCDSLTMIGVKTILIKVLNEIILYLNHNVFKNAFYRTHAIKHLHFKYNFLMYINVTIKNEFSLNNITIEYCKISKKNK